MLSNEAFAQLLHKRGNTKISGRYGRLYVSAGASKRTKPKANNHQGTKSKVNDKEAVNTTEIKQWKLLWDDKVCKDLRTLDYKTAEKIIDKIETHLIKDPLNIGKPLAADMSGLYSYRFGDYRVIYKVLRKEITIIVARVGHRRSVYIN